MRARFLLIFIVFGIQGFAQTKSLITELRDTPTDSITKIISLKELLKKTVNLEYDDSLAYETYNSIGLIFYSKNFPQYTEEFFKLALESAESMDDVEKSAQMLSNIGVVKEMSGDYVAALTNYQKSLESFIKAGNIKSQSLVYNNIAIVHQELGNTQQSYDNLKKSYNLKLSIKDSALIASALNNFGVFYEELKLDLDSALYFYNEANKLYNALGDKRNEAICYNNMALIFYKLKEYESARNNFEISIANFRALDDKLWLGKALMYLAQLELENGNAKKAVELLLESKSLITSTDYTRVVMEVSEVLAQAYLDAGQFKESAFEYKFFETLKDSLLNIEKQNEISKLEIKFQTAQKQIEIFNLQQEREIQNRRIIQITFLIIVIVLISGFVIIFLYMKGRQKKLSMQNKNMFIKQQILQNQMNPHFLFNVLTSIQSYMAGSDTEKASSYLSKFSRLTRMVLQSSAQDKILLSEEIELLTNYIELEQLRLNNAFSYELRISEDLDIEEIEIPPMMIQPFVENAIKHGLIGIENGNLLLEIGVKDNYVHFIVSDNGKGFDKNKKDSSNHKSMALSIINERAEILKQKMKRDVSIKYIPVEKGTKVEVMLPEI
jgi:tetratricopeptide (TPR) repeat protein